MHQNRKKPLTTIMVFHNPSQGIVPNGPKGYYWQEIYIGDTYLPKSELYGPYKTKEEASQNARNNLLQHQIYE